MTMNFPPSIISGRSNRPLAEDTAAYVGISLTACELSSYSDGELNVEISENIRGKDVFVIQSTQTPVNDNLMELLIIIDALRRASANRITAVLPYFGYARQDRKSKPRVPITAKLVADLITTAGADRILTMDLHAGQIMGFFNVPVDNLYARPVLLRHLHKELLLGEICIVSPDAGGVSRARSFAKRLNNAGLAIIDKRRSGPNEISGMNVVGDVDGKVAVLIDDLVDTAGTLVKATDALLECGAKSVYASCSHAVLSGRAMENIIESNIEQLIVSDTIYHQDLSPLDGKFVRLSVAGLLGEAIKRIHQGDSVSKLFDLDAGSYSS